MNRPEYEKLMERAPQIKASGLEGDYRLLAEFNDVVLAGHQTRYGMEFVTWEWVQNHTSLWQEPLAEVYRCVHETLDSEYPMTGEREKLLKDVAVQIERAVPNLDELVQKSNEAELLVQERSDTPGMTQQF